MGSLDGIGGEKRREGGGRRKMRWGEDRMGGGRWLKDCAGRVQTSSHEISVISFKSIEKSRI